MATQSDQHGPIEHAAHGGRAFEHQHASVFLEAMDGCTVVAATGEIDLCTSPMLREAMTAAVDSSPRIIIDLSAVTFLDSTGIGVLLAAYKSAAQDQKPMCLAGPSGTVAKVLRVTRLDKTITVHPNLDAALSATAQMERSGMGPSGRS